AEPDWSCYVEGDAGFLVLDDGGDGGQEADVDADDASDGGGADAEDGGQGTDGGQETDASDGGTAAADAATATRIFELDDLVKHTVGDSGGIDFSCARPAAGQAASHATPDDKGQTASLPPQGVGVLAYRVNTRADPAPTKSLVVSIQYDNVIPKAGGTLIGNS